MNKYEALYVIDAAMEDQARADLIALFQKLATDNGAEIEKVDEWGKRRLAYPINSAKPEFPRELERNFQINENIMRYLVTRIEE